MLRDADQRRDLPTCVERRLAADRSVHIRKQIPRPRRLPGFRRDSQKIVALEGRSPLSFGDMKTKAILFAIFAVLMCTAVVSAQSDPEREVRKLERAWLDAYEQNDAKAMNEIVADRFVITFPNGTKQTKADIMEMIRRAPAAQGRMRHHTEDVKAKVDGDTVVLTGRVISEYVVDGRAVSREESLYTDTYEKRDGKWRVVVSHLAVPKPAGKP